MIERGVPKQYQALYARTQAKSASPLQAVKMQCLECVGFVRDEVQLCTDTRCPLFQYRPYKPRGVTVRSERQREADKRAGLRLKQAKQAKRSPMDTDNAHGMNLHKADA